MTAHAPKAADTFARPSPLANSQPASDGATALEMRPTPITKPLPEARASSEKLKASVAKNPALLANKKKPQIPAAPISSGSDGGTDPKAAVESPSPTIAATVIRLSPPQRAKAPRVSPPPMPARLAIAATKLALDGSNPASPTICGSQLSTK